MKSVCFLPSFIGSPQLFRSLSHLHIFNIVLPNRGILRFLHVVENRFELTTNHHVVITDNDPEKSLLSVKMISVPQSLSHER